MAAKPNRGKLTLNKSDMIVQTRVGGANRPLNLHEQIQKKAKDLWDDNVIIEVEHEQSKQGTALGRTAPNGWHAVRVSVNGRLTGVSLHFNKSQAYRGVLRELEKLYERSLKE